MRIDEMARRAERLQLAEVEVIAVRSEREARLVRVAAQGENDLGDPLAR